jgi:predicted DNA-binding protein (MmcQ/YjbR family)
MDQHELKAQCLDLPGAVEDFPFGDEVSVFKVGGRCSRCAPSTASRCS